MEIARPEQRKMDLHNNNEMDESSRFCDMMADMVRRVREKNRPEAMQKLYCMAFELQKN